MENTATIDNVEEARKEIATRRRKVDLSSMTAEQADQLIEQLGGKIGNDVKEFAEKLNKTLNIYGLAIKMTYILHPENENPFEQLHAEMASEPEAVQHDKIEPKRKRGRPRKQ